MQKALRKGVPPLFVDLRPLYLNEEKVAIIQDLCEGYCNNLKVHRSFEATGSGEQEPATALLWLLYYMAQHFDYKREYQKALDTINEAIDHTPTLIGKKLIWLNLISRVFFCFFYVIIFSLSPPL